LTEVLALADGVLDCTATDLFVELAIKLRYHPASRVGCRASNGCMKIVRWRVAVCFGEAKVYCQHKDCVRDER
jgi:hypothetical protein